MIECGVKILPVSWAWTNCLLSHVYPNFFTYKMRQAEGFRTWTRVFVNGFEHPGERHNCREHSLEASTWEDVKRKVLEPGQVTRRTKEWEKTYNRACSLWWCASEKKKEQKGSGMLLKMSRPNWLHQTNDLPTVIYGLISHQKCNLSVSSQYY